MLITRTQISIVKKYFSMYCFCKDSKDEYERKMSKVVEKVIDAYKVDTEKSEFIRIALIMQKKWKESCRVLHIERRTYFAWREEILRDAVIYAAFNGLLDLGIEHI